MREKCIVILAVLLFVCAAATAGGFLHERKIKNQIMQTINRNFHLRGNDYVVVEYGNDYKDEGFTVELLKNQSPSDIKINNTVDVNTVGEYTITYTLKYKKQVKTLVRRVKIVDTVAPTLKLQCDKEQYVVKNTTLKDCNYKVSDNYDKDISSRVKVVSNVDTTKNGDYIVNYIVKDSSDNTTTKSITVHVRNKFELNYISISISKQRLDYYVNKKKVLTTPITSGRNNLTRTGTFKIRNKVRNTQLKGKDYVSEVKYWMAYDGNSFGIHDASWRRRFGTMDYKRVGSHGCINVPTTAMKKLYNMVEVGTPVYIKK